MRLLWARGGLILNKFAISFRIFKILEEDCRYWILMLNLRLRLELTAIPMGIKWSWALLSKCILKNRDIYILTVRLVPNWENKILQDISVNSVFNNVRYDLRHTWDKLVHLYYLTFEPHFFYNLGKTVKKLPYTLIKIC